ncbi:prepilin-type N-terminal cleavage/methylation domain-containing protein [Azospirillum sp. ST 5-10]|uniref:prepilin-type N-terminal cleavage/methylation domain-containing protein n=1 Tax=unclassified Azospirillum TaxID=2630922 RepID=UPI003F4A51E8
MTGHRAAGFTLLEVLLTVTLVGAAVAMAAGGLHLGRRAWEAGDRRLDRLERTATAHALIRQALMQALPARLVAVGGPVPAVFAGGPSAVSFLATRPVDAIVGGPLRVTVSAAGPPGALRLDLSVAPPGGGPERRTALLDGLTGVSFAYFGAGVDDDGPRWSPRWERTNRLPDLVRVTATLADGAPWPDLVVALPLR